MSDNYGFTPDEEKVEGAPSSDYGFSADPEESLGAKFKRYGAIGLEGLGKAAGYAQGTLVGGPFAMATEAFTGKDVFKPEEYVESIKGGKPFPAPSETLQRAGTPIPKGYSVSDAIPAAKDKWFDFSMGGAANLGLDIATDPMTYLSGGLSAASKAGKLGIIGKTAERVVNPIERVEKWNANRLYKKAMEEVDIASKEAGKEIPVSKILQQEKFSGGMSQALDKVKEVNKRAGETIGGILEEATAKGASVNLMEEFKPAMELAGKLRESISPEAHALAKEIDDRIVFALEKSGGVLPVNVANQEKSMLNQLIKDSGFAQSTDAAISTKAKKALSSDLSEAVKKSIEAVDPDLHKKLLEQNKIYGSTSGLIQDKIESLAKKASERRGPLGLTQVDMMLLGGGALGGALGGQEYGQVPLGMLGAKFLGRGLTSTEGRTARGLLANKLSNTIAPDVLLREKLKLNPWSIPEEEKK